MLRGFVVMTRDFCLLSLGLGLGRQISSNEESTEQEGERGVNSPTHGKIVKALLAGLHRSQLDLKHVDGDADPDEHLGRLQGSYGHGDSLGKAIAEGRRRVVGIHDRVHEVVHENIMPTGSRQFHCRMPTVDEDNSVMVPVKEYDRSLSKNQEESVE